MADSLDQKLEENAQAPKRVRVDGNEAEQHSLKDQITHAKYQASKKAAKRPLGGIGLTKVIPPGSV